MARKPASGGSVWLREPGGNWGGNLGVSNSNKGKSEINANYADFMRYVGKNLRINLSGKSKLPCMDEDIVNVFNVGCLHEERPMNMVDGKKTKIIIEGSGLRQTKVNNLPRMGKEEGSTFSTAEPIGQVSQTL